MGVICFAPNNSFLLGYIRKERQMKSGKEGLNIDQLKPNIDEFEPNIDQVEQNVCQVDAEVDIDQADCLEKVAWELSSVLLLFPLTLSRHLDLPR